MVDKISRRDFLAAAAGTTFALVTGCTTSAGERAVAPTIAARGSRPSDGAPAESAGSAVAQASHADLWLDDIFITPTDVFYLTQYRHIPEVKPAVWSLTIDGLVDAPLTLNYDDMLALPRFEKMRSLECIGNPTGGELIGNTVWTGFLLQDLLADVGVKDAATQARFEAFDGYSTSVDMEWIMQPETFMAYEMDGQPLTASHGFPLRIFMNGLYGQKMPKWITRIEFIDFTYRGYWESRGWSDTADIQTNSLVFSPPDLANVVGEPVIIQGVAYAGNRDVSTVEVQIGKEPWQAATLVKGPNDQVWTQWHLSWTPPGPGVYQVGVRASDDNGFTQRKESSGLLGGSFPNGTSEIHRVRINVA